MAQPKIKKTFTTLIVIVETKSGVRSDIEGEVADINGCRLVGTGSIMAPVTSEAPVAAALLFTVIGRLPLVLSRAINCCGTGARRWAASSAKPSCTEICATATLQMRQEL